MSQPLVPDRDCGACTACCHALEVKALAKPAGMFCPHNTGTACGIYQDRPAACAKWHCLWRKIATLPDELRPDRSGVMLSLETNPEADDPFLHARIVCRATRAAADLNRWEAVEAVAMFVREGSLPVWTAFGRMATLIYPESPRADDLRDAIRNPEALLSEDDEWEVVAWRQRLGYGCVPQEAD